MASLLGAGYESSDDDSNAPKTQLPATKVVAAPEVNTEVWSPDWLVPGHSTAPFLQTVMDRDI